MSPINQMIIERDVPIPSDGIILRANVFRPKETKSVPVIMALGPYGKGLEYKTGYPIQFSRFFKEHPDALPGSSRSFLTWETVDPEMFVPWGYAVIQVDGRGSGRSPGTLDIFSPQESRDYYNAIEWAGTREWSNGKVGLCGISYYGINQWHVAALQPPHLAAMVPWEAAGDHYRDVGRQGGIASNNFLNVWYNKQIVTIQNGNPSAHVDPWQNVSASGADINPLSEEQLKANRRDPLQDVIDHPLDDEFYRERSADWSKVKVPFVSCASWAGFGLHPRGNFEGFTQAASKYKWLECHPGRHEEWFYLADGMDIQKRFFDYFLKGIDNKWIDEPPVMMYERRAFQNHFPLRKEQAWPLLSTKWEELQLSAANDINSMSFSKPSTAASASFDALGEPLTFYSAPFASETEITGPLAAKLFASSTTSDMDLFLTLQAFSPEGKEVEFIGTLDPHTPLAQGWLRASQRKLDAAKSLPCRPYHSHDEVLPVTPGEIYELDVEILPTHVILPAGFRLALQIAGRDFERPAAENGTEEAYHGRGSGPFLHTHPMDRPEEIFGGRTTIYTGGEKSSTLLVPFIKNDLAKV